MVSYCDRAVHPVSAFENDVVDCTIGVKSAVAHSVHASHVKPAQLTSIPAIEIFDLPEHAAVAC